MKIRNWATAVALGTAGALAFGGPAMAQLEQADPPALAAVTEPDVPNVTTAVDDCEATLQLSWVHDSADQWGANGWAAYLLVQVDGEVEVVSTPGGQVDAGPYDLTEVEVSYQLFGGPERDYDAPPVAELDDLVAHLDGGGDLAEYEGWTWEPVTAEDCEPEPEPTATATATAEPTTEPSATPAPEETDTPGAGGGLPETSGLTTVAGLGLVGGLALAAGGGLVWFGRRRQSSVESME